MIESLRASAPAGMARQPDVFRASWWIRGGVLGALGAWLTLGAWALLSQTLPARSLWGIAFFVLFFLVFAAYYWRMRYVVDERGVTVRGAPVRGSYGRGHFPWESIESVRRSTVPLGGWEVTTAEGIFVLDVFVGRRSRLLDVIVARAGLFPTR